MHDSFTAVAERLGLISQRLNEVIPDDKPIAIRHNAWNSPCLNRQELAKKSLDIRSIIDAQGGDELSEAEQDVLADYASRLDFLLSNTLPQLSNGGHIGQAISAYLQTVDGLSTAIEPILGSEEARRRELVSQIKGLEKQARAINARLAELDPRTGSLETMVSRIEQASTAADQFPTDLQSLSEARKRVGALLEQVVADQSRTHELHETAERDAKNLGVLQNQAEAVLQNCEDAYSASTSVGLAAAFSERSDRLSRSMWIWVAGLICALAVGGYLGSVRLQSLATVASNPNAAAPALVFNLLLAILSVGAPVWFAWLATKQIGQHFRLVEDYAFKASVSRAYEGYRREAARVDAKMEAELLGSALTRLDELPLRLIEPHSHGSPWHELASSSAVTRAVETVPDFARQVVQLAKGKLGAVAVAKSAHKNGPQVEKDPSTAPD
ncbi:MAG: hypothetical protein KDA57_21925 [Planctomycetales bacterium]|nr:hypothetical protein [Planctomycetales bacterium]